MKTPLGRVLGAVCVLASATSCTEGISSNSLSAALDGAIFTSLADGSAVNFNIYDAKEDVYLDGGPGPNAPPSAAGLPEGDYYFQVTDPSGQTLLSSDEIGCRSFHVNADGVTDLVYPGPGGCGHLTGIDGDHADLGAITVQLMPYDDTPNMGGEYKVWVTAVDDYDPGKGKYGFLDNDSKTDNFKVKVPETEPYCGDGNVDEGEQCDDGNAEDGDGCSANCTVEHQPACGDGNVDEGEQCDDGNNVDGDGCSANCTVEHRGTCGDGIPDEGEQCDDGNNVDGDGCSANCTIETTS